jgi:hypothetical protein
LAQSSSSLLSLIPNKSQLIAYNQLKVAAAASAADGPTEPSTKLAASLLSPTSNGAYQNSHPSQTKEKNFELDVLKSIKKLDLDVPIVTKPTRSQQEPRFNSLDYFLNRNNIDQTTCNPAADTTTANGNAANKTTIKKIKIKKKKNKTGSPNQATTPSNEELQIDRITLSNRSSSLSTLSSLSVRDTDKQQDYEQLSASFRVNPNNASLAAEGSSSKPTGNRNNLSTAPAASKNEDLSPDFSVSIYFLIFVAPCFRA